MKAIGSDVLVVLLLSGLITGRRQGRVSSHTAGEFASESGIISLYDQLKMGMTRSQVQAIAGKPLFEPLRQPSGREEYWYIDKPERKMQSHESPWGPGGIAVTYKDDRLIDKKYNHQWVKRERRELYKRR